MRGPGDQLVNKAWYPFVDAPNLMARDRPKSLLFQCSTLRPGWKVKVMMEAYTYLFRFGSQRRLAGGNEVSSGDLKDEQEFTQ